MNKCKHNLIELIEGLTYVCDKCGIVIVDGYELNKKESLKTLIEYATRIKRSIYGEFYKKTMGVDASPKK